MLESPAVYVFFLLGFEFERLVLGQLDVGVRILKPDAIDTDEDGGVFFRRIRSVDHVKKFKSLPLRDLRSSRNLPFVIQNEDGAGP